MTTITRQQFETLAKALSGNMIGLGPFAEQQLRDALAPAGIEVEKTAEGRIEALVAELKEFKNNARSGYLELAKILDRHLPEVNQ